MAPKKAWYGRDVGLSIRMFITMGLLAVLYAAFVVVLLKVGIPWPTLVIILGLVFLMQYYFSDQLVLLAARARYITPASSPKLYQTVERLSQIADIPVPKIALMPTMMPNAFATGRNPKNAVITVTEGLLNRLDDQELEAVLAHELTHIKNRDVEVITIASFFAMVAAFIVQQIFFLGFALEDSRDRDGGGQLIIIIWLASLVVWALSYILIRTLSRHREYAADRGSAILTGHPGYLASALMKIHGGMRRTPSKDLRNAESFNAFFIFPAATKNSLMEVFSTHPSLDHRLKYLEKLQSEMEK